MQFNRKPEPDTLSKCIACLKNDGQIFGEYEMRPEILFMYKEIVKDHLEQLGHTTIEICLKCMEILSSLKDFKEKCIESIEMLIGKVVVKEEVTEEMIVDICTPLVKLEENPLEVELKFDDQEELEEQQPEETLKPKRKKPRKTNAIEAFCPICCNSHPDSVKHSLDFHTRGYNTDGSINCIVCSLEFNDIIILIEHLEIHNEYDAPKKCKKCDFVTKTRYEFIQHLKIIHYPHRNRLYACDFCDSVSFQSIYQKYHMRGHYGGLKCPYCDQCHFDKTVYEAHMEQHKKKFAETKFMCDHCNYFSIFKPALRKHILLHHMTLEKNVTCHICKKTFNNEFRLSKHLSCAHKDKKLPCSFCGKMYGSTNTLRKHMSHVHLMNAEEKRLLRDRERPKERKFSCDQCDKMFFRRVALKKHLHTHNKTRPFNCNLCKTGYYSNIHMRNHFLKVHEIVYTPKEVRKVCGINSVLDSD